MLVLDDIDHCHYPNGVKQQHLHFTLPKLQDIALDPRGDSTDHFAKLSVQTRLKLARF